MISPLFCANLINQSPPFPGCSSCPYLLDARRLVKKSSILLRNQRNLCATTSRRSEVPIFEYSYIRLPQSWAWKSNLILLWYTCAPNGASASRDRVQRVSRPPDSGTCDLRVGTTPGGTWLYIPTYSRLNRAGVRRFPLRPTPTIFICMKIISENIHVWF